MMKPCPFCGGEPRLHREADYDWDGAYFYSIECKSCGAKSKQQYASKGNDCPEFYESVRSYWNKRVETGELKSAEVLK